MEIKVNGEAQVVEESNITVTNLLKVKDVEMPDMVSVQLNGEFVDRENYDTQIVKDQDEVEFLYFMGGGAQ
ncbi:MAG: thiamine biosynthesis protein ThiS [SAR324 cluster bacterium]|uniref:Thiamine biosynthesis protein ThiS n=1 Tax=SAR324 cluster bacterium TaxID=2024889 RepID=A0A2A4T5D0_9DELT|nr:MAG: thiamine biosynthesis protein ThiS [SAR324 cluster bacterium]